MKKLAEKYPVEFVQRTSRRVEFESVFACRMCCASTLRLVMSLGHQALTGVFPEDGDRTRYRRASRTSSV